MVDTLDQASRSKRMSLIRGKNTRPEMVVRRIAHDMGYRYRLHKKNLPGTPDLVFARRRKVIFVHGCFWHRHPDSSCKLARLPKSRQDFWIAKLEANAERDARNEEQLRVLGWDVLVIWECELRDHASIRSRIASFIEHEVD